MKLHFTIRQGEHPASCPDASHGRLVWLVYMGDNPEPVGHFYSWRVAIAVTTGAGVTS